MPRRTLLLLRHAKSGYPDGVDDHDRPLSERGERDALAVSAALRGSSAPDLVLCSSALRARRTWEAVEAGLDGPTTVRYEPILYLASARAMLGLVRGTADDVHQLLVVAHNPGTQDLALALAGRGRKAALRRMREKYATCGLAVLRFDGGWGELDSGRAELVDFRVPRG